MRISFLHWKFERNLEAEFYALVQKRKWGTLHGVGVLGSRGGALCLVRDEMSGVEGPRMTSSSPPLLSGFSGGWCSSLGVFKLGETSGDEMM